MDPDLQDPQGVYQQPDYRLTVNNKDVTVNLRRRLIRLTLRESRGEEADTLDLELSDADGRLAIPPKGAKLTLEMGYTRGGRLVPKGDFVVDETEHAGAPDVLSIKARAADLGGDLRKRASASWHGKTIGDIVRDIARRNKLEVRIEPKLGAKPIQHIDQTDEPDIHFLTRLGRQHDAVATFKRGALIFLPIGTAENAKGETLRQVTITRALGDQHRYHTAARDSYTGVRAYWHDKRSATRRAAIAGTEKNLKTLKESYATEADALAAARAEMGRLERGEATLELTLAIGDPALMVQTPVKVQGFKQEIDGINWLIKTLEHTLDDNGLTTRLEMERKAGGNASEGGADVTFEDEADSAPGDPAE